MASSDLRRCSGSRVGCSNQGFAGGTPATPASATWNLGLRPCNGRAFLVARTLLGVERRPLAVERRLLAGKRWRLIGSEWPLIRTKRQLIGSKWQLTGREWQLGGSRWRLRVERKPLDVAKLNSGSRAEASRSGAKESRPRPKGASGRNVACKIQRSQPSLLPLQRQRRRI